MILSCLRCRVSFDDHALESRILHMGDPCPYYRDGSECRMPLVTDLGFVTIVRLVVER